MSVEKLIGVDLSTSSTAMKVKRYDENGIPLENGALSVVFNNMGQVVVPTMILKVKDAYYFGYDARDQKARKSVLYQNFKPELESPDFEVREKAWENTKAFLKYLADTYREQNNKGFFSGADERERTIISYPVKWSKETRGRLLEVAGKAGFRNVEGMDEAQAAIQAVLAQSSDTLIKQGYIKERTPVNILLIDMGAGTTDLVICRYTLGKTAKYEILSTYPKSGEINFGGSEIDVKLRDYISGFVPQEGIRVMQNIGVDAFKSWKETLVSPVLLDNEMVETCEVVNNFLSVLGLELKEFTLDRREFESICKGYLDGFPKLVSGCIKEAGLSGGDIDLVITTGGHSQWYFVNEMLLDQLAGFTVIGLDKIRQDQNRLIAFPRPQETVSLGLVYGPMVKAEQDRIRREEELRIKKEREARERMERERKAAEEARRRKEEKEKELRRQDIINRYKKNAKAMVCSTRHGKYVAAVKPDGTVATNSDNQDIKKWNDIISVTACLDTCVGLKRNGTVVTAPFAGDLNDGLKWISDELKTWDNIIATSSSCYDGCPEIAGLKENGKVVATIPHKHDVGSWGDIVSIDCESHKITGITKNSKMLLTPIYAGNNLYWFDNFVSFWYDIVEVASGLRYVLGLAKDGRVYMDKPRQYSFYGILRMLDPIWTNISAIACGLEHALGLKEDGTVISMGENGCGQCNVDSWRNVKSIACGPKYSVGLKQDGSIYFTGQTENKKNIIPSTNNRIITICTHGESIFYITDKGNIIYSTDTNLKTTKWSIFDK